MKRVKKTPTYEEDVLAVLVFEGGEAYRADSERKIKRRLREKKLGPYDQERIDLVRRFNDDIKMELKKRVKSRFWRGENGGRFSKMEDWDVAGFLTHLLSKHPTIPKETMTTFLPYAIYLYYLR